MAFKKVFEGRVWIFGENVDTDQILPGYAMSAARDELKNFAMSGSARDNFASEVEPGDIIVAEKNFGCGSSREQAPVALQQAGVAAVIAPSFARIFRRNCINIGLPVLRAQLFDKVGQGAKVRVDLDGGYITVLATDERISFEPLSENVKETLSCGGLVNRVRMQLGIDAQEAIS